MNKAANRSMTKTVIHASVVSALSVLYGVTTAYAQDETVHAKNQEAAAVEEVLVTGIRGSLMQSMDVKRDAQGVVDAISAEDIGKFPDTNLAESLQRITGVSIDRKNNEGNQVSVRGFGPSFNLVTLNGRQMPAAATAKQEGDSTAEQSRAFNFAEIAAESVSAVEVYKTAKASNASGGIGATVNIKTARPLDHVGLKAVGSVKGVFDQSVETGQSITPEVSGLISQTFMDDTFGLLFSGSFAERHNRQNFVATDGWLRVGDANIDTSGINADINPAGQVWLPRNIVVDKSDHERERLNAQIVAQYSPQPSLTFTFDYTMSDYKDVIERSQTGIWFESPNPSGETDANGSVINPTITQNANTNLGALDFQGYSDVVETENDSIGLNVEWEASDNLSFNIDYHNSRSEAQPNGDSSDFLVILSGPLGVSTTAQFNGGVPVLTIDDSAVQTLNPDLTEGYDDPNGLRPNIDLLRNKAVSNEVQQLQMHALWDNDVESGLTQVRAGLSWTDYRIDTHWQFDLGVQGQPACGATCADVVTLENTAFPSVFPTMLTFNAGDVFSDVVADMNSVFDLAFENRHAVSEETSAAYVELNFDTELAGKPFKTLMGVRYEHTAVAGTTLQNSPEAMVFISETEFRPQFTDEVTRYSLKSSYDVFLPSLDMQWEFAMDWIGRFSYGKSLARSDLNSMKPALSIGDARPGGPYNASQGNPGLLPYLSDNVDFAIEWYYQEGSYAAINFFKKWVDNYVVSTITQGEIVGALGYPLTDPNPTGDPNFTPNTVGGPDDSVINWDILSFTNGESAQVSGWELALQHLFGDTGFGVQMNATLVSGDVEYDIYELDQSVALTGLSDSANIVGFYEQDAFQIRLAYNWRDKFLLATNQLRQMNEPVFIEAYGQWDLNASYDINDSASVFVEGLNITSESAAAHGRFDNQFLYFDDQKPRFNLGVRASW